MRDLISKFNYLKKKDIQQHLFSPFKKMEIINRQSNLAFPKYDPIAILKFRFSTY